MQGRHTGPLTAIALLFLIDFQTAAAIQLRLVDALTRKPLTDATIECDARGQKNLLPVDPQGSATIPIAQNQDVRVIARKPGFAPIMMHWPSGKAPTHFELPLPQAQTIGGRIVDQSGRPVAGGQVTVVVPRRLAGPFINADDLTVKSGTNGSWQCEAVPKNAPYVELEISHPDFDLISSEASRDQLVAGQAHCVMTEVVTLRGRVLDDAGHAVSGAEVFRTQRTAISPGSATSETTTDSEGRFAFVRVHPQRQLLGVKADGFAPALQFLEVTNLPSIEMRLARGSPLALRVVDDAGNGIPGASVRVDEWPARLRGARGNIPARWSYPGWEWQTDTQGRFAWANAPTGRIDFSISKGGYMRQSRHDLEAASAEQIVTLGPTFHIRGAVLDAQSGKPVPAFTINARFASISSFNGRFDTNWGPWQEHNRRKGAGGKFALNYDSPLLSGSRHMHDWQFSAEADGYEPQLSRVVADAERGTNIEFRLKPQPVPEIAVPAPSDTNRVTARLAIQPSPARSGEAFTLFLKARLAPGFYIYALDDSGCSNLPTSLASLASPFFKPDGPWRGPEPKVKEDGARTLAGDILFHQRFTAVDLGIGPLLGEKLRVVLRFQVCNEALCWPPETIPLATSIDVLASQ